MGKWKEEIYDDIQEDNLIGLVRNKKQQSFEFEFDYLKMNNITDDGNLDITSLVKVDASKDEVEKYTLKKGDFLFNTRNSVELVGKTAVYNIESSKPMLFNNNIMRSRFKKDFDPYFINYQFQSSEFKERLEKIKSGTTNVAAVYYKSLKDIKLKFPPLPEQHRIVTKLDGLFVKIDQAIGLLEENILHTQALMGSVLDEEFGRFEEFNQPIKSFCINPKKDMVGGPFGSNLKASEYVDSGFPIIRLQNVDRFNFKEKNIMFVTEEKAEFLSSHSYVSGDIVMTKLGDPLGKCCIVEDVHGVDRGVISSDIIRIRIDETKHYKPYVVAGINSEYFIKQLKSKTQGSTRPRVTLKEVREMQLPMLKREDQVTAAKRIDGILELQSKVLETQTQKLNHLKALKSSLLDQAFKGEL